jgi:protein-arginine kinase
MGVDMGVIKELSDDDIAKIYFYMEPANLQKYFNQNLDGYDRDIKRGEMIRTIVKK